MIKINLALKRQSSLVTDASPGSGVLGKMSVPGLKLGVLKELPIRRFIVPTAFYLIAAQMSEMYKKQLVDDVVAQIAQQSRKVSALEAEAAKLKDYEKLKMGLETDQSSIRNKMNIISELLAERTSKLRLLADLSSATPTDVWLKSIDEMDGMITISGSTESFNSIPDYLANLSEVKYLKNVKLINGTKALSTQKGSSSGTKSQSGEEESLPVFEIQAYERLE